MTVIVVRLWPSTSCRSRASRARSSATASVAISSRAARSSLLDLITWRIPNRATVSTMRIDAEPMSGTPSDTVVPISRAAVTEIPNTSPMRGGSCTSAMEITYVM